MISDTQLAITTIVSEAGNQPHEGRVAVGIVILNRKFLPYASDGTMVGTCLHRWAFSEYWAAMVDGVYKQTEFDLVGAETKAQAIYEQVSVQAPWTDCALAWADAQCWFNGVPMTFTPGPAFAGLTKKTVLYYAPKVCKPPIWAVSANQDAVIYDHVFFHDNAA